MSVVKRLVSIDVDHLQLTPAGREVENKNGTKSVKVGALILLAPLPRSGEQTVDQYSMNLSAKQLDKIASVHGIRETGEPGWRQLQNFVNSGTEGDRASVVVVAESHEKGDTYINIDGEEDTYDMSVTQSQVSSITLPKLVLRMKLKDTIKSVRNFKPNAGTLRVIGGVKAPVVAGASVPDPKTAENAEAAQAEADAAAIAAAEELERIAQAEEAAALAAIKGGVKKAAKVA
jgi:hypothetical protein